MHPLYFISFSLIIYHHLILYTQKTFHFTFKIYYFTSIVFFLIFFIE